jgi:hypothetical protein
MRGPRVLLLLCLAGPLAGCAATGLQPGSRLSLWKPAKPAEEPIAKSQDENPFRKTAAATSSADSDAKPAADAKVETAKADAPKPPTEKPPAKVETASATKDAGEKPKNPPTNRTGVFGPETLRLIDAELADAAPAERAYWYDQLKKVDPAVIPQILQARRLTAQIAERQNGPESQSDGTTGDNPFAAPGRAGGEDYPSNAPGVRDAMERRLSDAKGGIDATQYQVDRLPPSTPVSQWNTPAENVASKYAVTRVDPGESSQAAATPASGPSRNPLTRFLPMGGSLGVTQTSANSPSGVSLLPPTEVEPRGVKASLDQLISLMEAEVAQLQPGETEAAQTEYIRRHVHLRMLYLMADHPERALTAIPGIDAADQEFWQQSLWAVANYFDVEHIPAAKDRAGQTVAQLATATQRLREKADLEIRNLAFCREITYFGNIVRFPRDEFRPGDSALVYAEIENFKSELTVDGQNRTLLRSTLEILSPSGEVRWHKEFSATEDLCLNQRRDYFHNYSFVIPDRLPLGPHVLKLTVFDELSGKMVSQSLNFVVR